MPGRWLFLTVALVIGSAGGCSQPPAVLNGSTDHTTGDPDFSVLPLLERPDLQEVVDRQVKRDTAALAAWLQDDDTDVRARAALALGSLRAAGVIDDLTAALADSVEVVRSHAAFALGQTASIAAAPALIDALFRETDAAVLAQILHALGKTGDRPVLGITATAELPASLEADRALAIARFGMRGVHDPAAVAFLIDGLESPNQDLRTSAAYYFARATIDSMWTQHAARLRSTAENLAFSDPARAHLATGLGRLGDTSDDGWLISTLESAPDWRTRVNAARSLGHTARSALAMEALAQSLRADVSFHVSAAAAEALGRLPALPVDYLDQFEEIIQEDQEAWQVWHGLVPALAGGGRFEVVENALATLDSRLAEAAVVRGWAADTTETGFRRLADLANHVDARVAAAAIEALRSHPLRDSSPDHVNRFFEAMTEAVERMDGATIHAAAPALADSVMHEMGAGRIMRKAYERLDHRQSIGVMAAMISAHGAARDTSALNFILGAALRAPHPVLREAAIGALNDRFMEGITFSSVGGNPPTFRPIDWQRLRRLGARPVLTLDTNRGRIVLALYPEWAPATVDTITRFAEEEKYDGVFFHRVVSSFVIQGGDFGARDGLGGPGIFLPSEFTPVPYTPGTLGMASSGPDTEGSQFFITHSSTPHLDGRYTVFGEVLSGQEVVDEIRVGDRILTARVTPTR